MSMGVMYKMTQECKKCGGIMYINQISDDEFEAECDSCGYLIN